MAQNIDNPNDASQQQQQQQRSGADAQEPIDENFLRRAMEMRQVYQAAAAADHRKIASTRSDAGEAMMQKYIEEQQRFVEEQQRGGSVGDAAINKLPLPPS